MLGLKVNHVSTTICEMGRRPSVWDAAIDVRTDGVPGWQPIAISHPAAYSSLIERVLLMEIVVSTWYFLLTANFQWVSLLIYSYYIVILKYSCVHIIYVILRFFSYFYLTVSLTISACLIYQKMQNNFCIYRQCGMHSMIIFFITF